MNNAESLGRTLAATEVDVCFANSGTSQMHFVAALDRAWAYSASPVHSEATDRRFCAVTTEVAMRAPPLD